jgi:hypothetical protein
MLCTGTASDLALAKHKLKDAQLFVARQLAQSGKQDKMFTCRHDIHLPRASGQVLSYTSVLLELTVNI